MSLRQVDPKPTYRKFQSSLASQFYGPCLLASDTYQRAVGFFSSAIYSVAWRALKAFVSAGGRMRLVCSPYLGEDDLSAMEEGHKARLNPEEALLHTIDDWLADDWKARPAKVLGSLIAAGILEVRIAVVRSATSAGSKLLFHDKLGIFRDKHGDFVVFKGSMNETWLGLSDDGHLESVDVSISWDIGRDGERAHSEAAAFDQMWEGRFPGVEVIPFPDAPRKKLEASARDENWEEIVDDLVRHEEETSLGGRRPFRHQCEAVTAWEDAGHHGILAHATGSGKTFTSMIAIKDAIDSGFGVVVLVPSSLLFKQWNQEITFNFQNVRRLLIGDGWNGWKRPGVLEAALRATQPTIVLATMQTAATDTFRGRVRRYSNVLLVADECHRMGSPEHRLVLHGWDCTRRLGLSATPKRYGDEAGTRVLREWFGPIVHEFGIEDAIKAGRLTRYWYEPLAVGLNADETEAYTELSKKIAQLWARVKHGDKDRAGLEQQLQTKLLARARIVKQAAAKVPLAVRLLSENYREGQHWLVYCDSQAQMAVLGQALKAAGLDYAVYHSQMTGDKSATLRHFGIHGGILLSIKCLDEGVDIPVVSHALILASSRNPREYVQRRGRVLRKHRGKPLAYIYDALVTPPFSEGDTPPTFVEGEISRALEFGRHAVNPGCVIDLESLSRQYGLERAIPDVLDGVEA